VILTRATVVGISNTVSPDPALVDNGTGWRAKWACGRYHTDGVHTSRLKIKTPDYSQMAGRREMFEQRRERRQLRRRDYHTPALHLP
jgi:hypothetical protein